MKNSSPKTPYMFDRTKGIGTQPRRRDSIGASGPMIRASGMAWDIRKREPYSGYENYDFDVPVETGCDVLLPISGARSRNAAKQSNTQTDPGPLAGGPHQAQKAGVIFPPQEEIYTRMESLIHHFMLVVEGVKPPKGEVLSGDRIPQGRTRFATLSAMEAESP